ncbi:hypothetical protein EUGRSUZ_A01434 [Eucalyptus grandis]|uniref:Uncharacterized protein n=2 Tax=Eucalyptus grandis TaxID=71139 RepID=A0ACC3M471_EUCGR|nr:hypothetical protein EUGRSUZ_A01434 [Eucalyptus grandis]
MGWNLLLVLFLLAVLSFSRSLRCYVDYALIELCLLAHNFNQNKNVLLKIKSLCIICVNLFSISICFIY